MEVSERSCILTLVVVSGVYTTVKKHRIAFFKWMQFIACKLFLNTLGKEKISRSLLNSLGVTVYLP